MSGESPLGDLREQLDESAAGEPEREDYPNSATEDHEREEPNGPAFDFTNDLQRSVYPRQESWQALQDTIDFEVKRRLADRGIRDFAGREAHDAMVTLAAENPELIVERILEARGIEPDGTVSDD